MNNIIKADFSPEARELFFQEMLRLKVIFIEKNFKSSAGYKLPFYGNFRKLISSPKLLSIIGKELGRVSKELNADILAGASMSGDAWTASASLASNIPCILLRKDLPHHGDQTIIVGEKPNFEQNIILIEDGIGTAGQAKNFVMNMRKEGYYIKNVLAIFDSMEGDGEKEKLKFFQEEGVRLTYLFKLREYFEYIFEHNLISKEFKDIIIDWLKDPKKWNEESEKWKWYLEEETKGNIWLKY